jgi:hypothetical protein
MLGVVVVVGLVGRHRSPHCHLVYVRPFFDTISRYQDSRYVKMKPTANHTIHVPGRCDAELF